jgi:hypothetical protein
MTRPAPRKHRILAPFTAAVLVAGITAASATLAHRSGRALSREEAIDQKVNALLGRMTLAEKFG